MEIKDAKSKIERIIERADGNCQALLSLAINALDKSGAEYSNVSDSIQALLENESVLTCVSEKWAEDVYIAALAMKRQMDCKAYLKDKDNKHIIDGETASMWVSIISAIIGVLATAAVGLLLLFNVIDSVDIDSLAYIITLASWLITIIVSVIARIINKHQTKKHDKNSEYTVAELMAVKYEDSSKIVKAVLPPEIKRPLIHAARDINIKKMDFTSNTSTPNVPDMDADRDVNIGEITL